MGGIVTQKRPLLHRISSFWTNGSLTRTHDLDVSNISGPREYASSQVTTGFRSVVPPGVKSLESKEEDILLGRARKTDSISDRRKRYDTFDAERRREGRTKFDNGHEFSSVKRWTVLGEHDVQWSLTSFPWTSYRYSGPVGIAPGTGSPGYTYVPFSAFTSGSYGTRAIQATIPTNPRVGLAQGIAELRREGLPRIIGSSFLPRRVTPSMNRYANKARWDFDEPTPSDVGSEFLNYEFGLKPIGVDLGKAAYALSESNRLLSAYERGSGRIIRRGYTFPEEFSESVYGVGTTARGIVSNLSGLSASNTYWGASGANNVPVVGIVRTWTKIWFKGAYTYYMPQGIDPLTRAMRIEQKMNHLLGTRVSPSVVWELTPWSWLIDWNGHVGDVLHNIDYLSSDGLILAYGYLMRETVSEHSLRTLSPLKGKIRTTSYITHAKERIRANPYGWGPTSAYTAKQWSILGALGLAKAPGILNRN